MVFFGTGALRLCASARPEPAARNAARIMISVNAFFTLASILRFLCFGAHRGPYFGVHRNKCTHFFGFAVIWGDVSEFNSFLADVPGRKSRHKKFIRSRNSLISVNIGVEFFRRKSINNFLKMFVFRIFLLTLHSQN